MRKLYLLAILAFLSLATNGQNFEKAGEINVLFIGNSLTYFNNMPQVLQKMITETDPHIKVEQISYPGFSLYAHLEHIIEESSEGNVKTRKKRPGEVTETEKKIQEKNWDIIVMQTGGVNILIPKIRNRKVNPAIQEIIRLSNCEAKYLLFNTWTTEINYPQEYCYPAAVIDRTAKPGEKFCSPEILNEEAYAELLESGYHELANDNALTLTDHAEVFKKVREEHPDIALLEDEMHPSKYGAFLSASVFYESITGKKAGDLRYTADLEEEIAKTLKNSLREIK